MLLALFLLLLDSSQQTPNLSQSWQFQKRGDETVVTKKNPAPGELTEIVVGSVHRLRGQAVRDWFMAQVAADANNRGRLTSPGVVKEPSTGKLSIVRGFSDASGRTLVLMYVSIPVSSDAAVMLRLETSDLPHATQYAGVLSEIAKSFLTVPVANSSAPAPTPPINGYTAARGTLYSIRQLGGLIDQTWNNTPGNYLAKHNAVDARLRQLTPFFVTGTVDPTQTSPDSLPRLTFDSGKYRAKYKLACLFTDSDANAKLWHRSGGREITVAVKEIDRFDNGMGPLVDHCPIVPSVAPLTRSTLPEDGPLERKPVTVEEVITEKPGSGVRPEQIKAIYFSQSSSVGMDGFGNGFMNVNEETYLLLKDGTSYQYSFGIPPSDLDIAKSRAEEKSRWGTWQQRGASFVVRYKDEEGHDREKEMNGQSIVPFPSNNRMEHTFNLMRVRPGGLTTQNYFTFKADGHFENSSSALMAAKIPGVGVNGASKSSSAVISTNSMGESMLTAAPSAQSRVGTYSVNGYALTLNYADGRSERLFFGVPSIYDSRNPKFVYLEGSLYADAAEKRK